MGLVRWYRTGGRALLVLKWSVAVNRMEGLGSLLLAVKWWKRW